jgi:superfamily II DNA or RNA helicase
MHLQRLTVFHFKIVHRFAGVCFYTAPFFFFIFIMITLYPYQKQNIIDISHELVKHKQVIYQLPTGGGKTIIFTEIAHRFLVRNPDKSVVIMVHRTELIRQTKKNLYKEYDIVAFEVIAGVKTVPKAQVYLCMVESMGRRIDLLQNVGTT